MDRALLRVDGDFRSAERPTAVYEDAIDVLVAVPDHVVGL
jgi:hypothetical protein